MLRIQVTDTEYLQYIAEKEEYKIAIVYNGKSRILHEDFSKIVVVKDDYTCFDSTDLVQIINILRPEAVVRAEWVAKFMEDQWDSKLSFDIHVLLKAIDGEFDYMEGYNETVNEEDDEWQLSDMPTTPKVPEAPKEASSEKVYRGWLTFNDFKFVSIKESKIPPYTVDLVTEDWEDGVSITELVNEDWEEGTKVFVSYYISPVEVTLERAQEALLSKMFGGGLDVEYELEAYSEYTIEEWKENLVVGGHDIIKELSTFVDNDAYLVLVISKAE